MDEVSGNWKYTDPDWTEFENVIAGRGLMNKERLEARKKAHKEGEWVRLAAQAFAQKNLG